MEKLYAILAKLISFASVTPEDKGCQDYLIQFLESLGFTCQRFDNLPVSNFFARLGEKAPLLIFAGHTDVVPVGEATQWQTNPFLLHESKGMLYGRGVADMKGSLASMMIMAEKFVKQNPSFNGSLGFLITSGEEGDLFNLGTPYVMEELYKQGIKIDYCVVGEPSSRNKVGDVIKVGRRGSLTGHIILEGKQGHVAYPHLARNPIHEIAPFLVEITNKKWDKGNEHFIPTSFQITSIQAGGQANNIIPGQINLSFNFRFSTEQTADSLKKTVSDLCKKHQLETIYLKWQLNGEPFLTGQGTLLQNCIRAIETICHQSPELSTDGGTSDGRFIAPYGVEVIELGPVNATIHQVNESVALNDLEQLSLLYYSVAEQTLNKKERKT